MIPKSIHLTPDNIFSMGSTLKIVREEKGIRQYAVAEAMACPQSMISQLEASVKIPALFTLINYCDCLGYDIVLVQRS